MDSAAKSVLRTQRHFVTSNLCTSDIQHVLEYLENENIITESHVQIIQAQLTDNGKIGQLLYILSRRGPDAFSVLIDSLKPDYDFIADKLQSEYETELEKYKQDGIPESDPQDSLFTLQEPFVCEKCLQGVDLDSNDNWPTNQNTLKHNQPIRESNLSTNHMPGNGPCDSVQPMESKHSEFMNKMMTESLNVLYTKLKAHLTTRNIRELSFQSPEPVSFVMVENLLDELIKEVENCFRALDAKDRHSLLTHVITLKDSKKKLNEDLQEITDLKDKYAKVLIKEQNRCRQYLEQIKLKDMAIKKLTEEKKDLVDKLEERDGQVKELSELEDKSKEETELMTSELRNAERNINNLEEKLLELEHENEKLRQECQELKECGFSKRFVPSQRYRKIYNTRPGIHYAGPQNSRYRLSRDHQQSMPLGKDQQPKDLASLSITNSNRK